MAVNGVIIALHEPYAGKYADAKVLRLSGLENQIAQLNQVHEINAKNRLFVYSDKGYGQSLQVVPPKRNPAPGKLLYFIQSSYNKWSTI